jgi:hypothetical protein
MTTTEQEIIPDSRKVEEPKAESKKAEAKVTTYNILTSDQTGSTWTLRGAVEASSAERAVRMHLESLGSQPQPVQVVAVSGTHWQPKRPKVETHTTIKLL